MSQKKQLSQGQATLIFNGLLVLLLVAFLVLVYGRANADDIALADIGDIYQEKNMVETMEVGDERDVKQFIGIDPTAYEEILYYRGTEALSVDEILIIKAKDKEALPAAQDAVEERVAAQIKAFEGYGPEQVKRLGNAVIVKRGNYLFYCVAEDPEIYEEVFKDAI